MTMEFDGNAVVSRAGEDREFMLAAREWTGSVRLEMGARTWVAQIAEGKLCSFHDDREASCEIVVSGPQEVWAQMLAATPLPGYTDIFVATLMGLRVHGDPVSSIGPYYPALQRLIAILRDMAGGQSDAVRTPYPFRDSDVARCRYVPIDVGGVTYRIFVQEAGAGVPLLLQHSGGADSRQWRHLLADPDLQKRFRMIAYDLPFHGKSLPPEGIRWWTQEYAATKEELMQWVIALGRALRLDRPIFMGCAFGGQLALDLAAHHGEAFGAIVAMNGFYHQDGLTSAQKHAPALASHYFHHPRIREEYYAALVYGAGSPHAPETGRREAQWIAASNGRAVAKGDHEYFMSGHDLRKDGHLIDAHRTPLWVVAGDYDGSMLVTDGGARSIAEKIPGVELRILGGLGHMMMSDDPMAFRRQIIPILDEASARMSPRDRIMADHDGNRGAEPGLTIHGD